MQMCHYSACLVAATMAWSQVRCTAGQKMPPVHTNLLQEWVDHYTESTEHRREAAAELLTVLVRVRWQQGLPHRSAHVGMAHSGHMAASQFTPSTQ
jgi:hypothetical protein